MNLEKLDKTEFIKVSNSCIINLNFVKYFDLRITGKITIGLKDNSKENVPKKEYLIYIKYKKGERIL